MSKLIRDGIILTNDIYGTKFKVDLMPGNHKYRRTKTQSIKDWIAVHNTGNPRGDETMHTNYVDKVNGYISWHLTVGADFIYQELPLHEAAYHAGDGGKGKGNYYSIGMEIVEAPKSRWNEIKKNAIKAIVFLMNNVDSLIGDNWAMTIRPHQYFSGKKCPRIILAETGGFKKFTNDCIDYNEAVKNIKNIQLTTTNNGSVNIKQLEKAIVYDLYDKYWKENFEKGTLNRVDIAWLLNKVSGKDNVNDALNVFKSKGWTTDKAYWEGVVNGATKYKRVFLNTILNRAIKDILG